MADSQRKTANLFDKDDDYTVGTTTNDYMLTGLLPNHSYTCSTNFTYPTKTTASIYFGGGSSSVNGVWSDLPQTKQTDSNGNIVLHIRWKGQADAPDITEDVADGTIWIMVNEGSTPLPYEPYGWVHSLRKLTTATDTITTLPADLYADGNNATVGLQGNMQQTGTPTPQNPIQPSECGDRTRNLFDANWLSNNTGIGSNGEPYPYNGRVASYTPIILTGNSVALSFSGAVNAIYSLFDSNDTLLERTANITSGAIINTTGAAKMYLCFYKTPGAITTDDVSNIMVSSTAKPYEPYGYKIPISSASTTTPVYLGEVETTRKIYQQIFKGDENWQLGATNLYTLTLANSATAITDGVSAYSSHYQGVPSRSSYSQLYSDQICIRNTGTQVWIRSNDITTEADFKTYLQQQYAAGTPVIVWYVLATETTGIVNEPLRKIGEYADTVSGITIPTITGKDTFDVQTTLKPSEVELTYTGWHDASVKEWDGSEWQ